MISDKEQIRIQLEAGITSSEIILNNEKLLRYSANQGFIRPSEIPERLAELSRVVMLEELDMLRQRREKEAVKNKI